MLTPRLLPDGRVPVLLSAHAADLLRTDADAVLRYCERNPDTATPARVAGTLAGVRRVRKYRSVIRAADRTELIDGLRAVRDGTDHPLVAHSETTGPPAVAFVVPGQGSQWQGMGAEAYRLFDEYRAEADRCADAFVAHGVSSPLRYLTAAAADPATQIDIQGAQFIHAAALARVWQSYGIAPSFTVGHSLGEVAAAYLAGSITRPDAAAAVIGRANAVAQLHGRYGMAVLGVSAEAAEALIADTAGWLELSAVNSPAAVVVSGDRAAISAITAAVAEAGRFARELTVDYPGHTSALSAPGEEMRRQLPDIVFAEPAIPFIGASTGAAVPAGAAFAEHWQHNLRSTVRFDQAVRSALEAGARAFVELSAHPALLPALADLTDGLDAEEATPVVGSGRRDAAVGDELSVAITTLALADPGYRWRELTEPVTPPLPGFPNAPMRAERLWIAPQTPAPTAAVTTVAERWERDTETRPAQSSGLRRVAVTEMATGTALTDLLRAAVDRHPGLAAATPEEAETLVVVAPPLDHPDAIRAAEDITELVGSGLLHYVDAIGARCREVCLLTVGGEQVHPGEPVALPAQAALAALHRTVGFEHSDQAFRHLDLPSWEPGADLVAAALDGLLTELPETAVRLEGPEPARYRRTLADVPAAPAWALDSGVLDNVVITGGGGAIGGHYARFLAERGARRIVLLSRRGADPAVLAELNGYPGVTVLAPPCDITDAEQLRTVAAEFADGGASLVVHAAAVATLGSGDGFTAAEFADTFGAKVIGLAQFSQHWPMRTDSRMLLCSSVSGVWGGRGHPAYPAANRMLDVMAGQLRAKRQHCVSVRWGLWQVDGIADAAEMVQIARSGLRPMPPDLAIAASLAEHRIDPMVLAADVDRLRVFFDTQLSGAGQESTPPDHPAGPDGDVDATAAVRTELAAVLRAADPALIDLDAALFDLGVDSLLALDLRKRLKRVTGRTVPLAKLLGGITGTGVVAEIDGARTGTRPDAEPTQKVDSSRD